MQRDALLLSANILFVAFFFLNTPGLSGRAQSPGEGCSLRPLPDTHRLLSLERAGHGAPRARVPPGEGSRSPREGTFPRAGPGARRGRSLPDAAAGLQGRVPAARCMPEGLHPASSPQAAPPSPPAPQPRRCGGEGRRSGGREEKGPSRGRAASCVRPPPHGTGGGESDLPCLGLTGLGLPVWRSHVQAMEGGGFLGPGGAARERSVAMEGAAAPLGARVRRRLSPRRPFGAVRPGGQGRVGCGGVRAAFMGGAAMEAWSILSGKGHTRIIES